MKTLKFFMVPCVLTLVAMSTAIAQPNNKDFGENTTPYTGTAFCGTEVVKGTLTLEWKVTVENEWFQTKRHWSLIGQESGAHYEADNVMNVHYKIAPSGVEYENFTLHMRVKRDNVPLGFIHENFHFTVDPNGNLTVILDNWFFECFENR